MSSANLDKAAPPYMSLSVLKATVEAFANSVVPTALDRHVLSKMSGAAYGSLISGLRFLGLVEPNGTKPTEAFRRLVKAREKGEDDYQSELLMVINDAYEKIVGNVDIDSGTLNELEKAFRDYGVSPGQMLKKTVRFYVKAIQEAGITPSPHITKPRAGGNGAQKKTDAGKSPRRATAKKTRRTTAEPELPTPPASDSLPTGFARQPIPGMDGAFIQYPVDLSDADCTMFEAIVGVLRTYVKGRSGKKEKT
jgi:hypothetical protein